MVVYKNNSDRKGNSYGTHENYLMDRQVPFSKIVAHAMPHLITRQIFTGAGKVGTEASGLTSADVPFQLTQRADFFEEEVGLETTLKRPIVNTRDEPHADAQKYRRLHVIVGDANLSEVATFLKVGTTALVLSMIEDDWLRRDLLPARPGADAAPRRPTTSTLAEPIELANGTTMTALEVQWEYLDRARKLAEERGLECIGGDEVGDEVLAPVGDGPHRPGDRPGQRRRPGRLGGQAPPHRRLPRAPRPALGRRPPRGHGPAVPRPPSRQVAGRPRAASSGSPPTRRCATAVHEPPTDTRAYFRGRCLQRWPDNIVAANWDSLVFDVGGDPLRRVPMMEPLRGTQGPRG